MHETFFKKPLPGILGLKVCAWVQASNCSTLNFILSSAKLHGDLVQSVKKKVSFCKP